VDFDGPHGWEFGAVNLGQIDIRKESEVGVPWGIRRVLPLIEVRVPFTLHQQELDDISRGKRDADLDPLEDAARDIARFEESVIYNGFDPGCIQGILQQSKHETIPLPEQAENYPDAVAEAAKRLEFAGFPAPYTLVLSPNSYYALIRSAGRGVAPRQLVAELIQGKLLLSTALQGGVLMATGQGNFQLSVGQDLSIGYHAHSRETVDLYLTESFTFRVLQPPAAIGFTMQ
jgi:uncharacterized linocin/CFP29 family protein